MLINYKDHSYALLKHGSALFFKTQAKIPDIFGNEKNYNGLLPEANYGKIIEVIDFEFNF